MLEIEARWVGRVLNIFDACQLSPILNVGSATVEFRQQVQPYIDQWIFAPLRARGVKVHHLDMQEGNGIDLQGDLNDERFLSRLLEHRYRTVLCCNLLEHVTDPSVVSANIERLVPDGGHVIVTVPYRFPYHPDPIDTMFRPSPNDLFRLFPSCHPLEGVTLDAGTGWDYVEHNPWKLFLKLKRRLSGLRQHGGMKGTTSFLPYLFRRFHQTCVLLQKGPTSSMAGQVEGQNEA